MVELENHHFATIIAITDSDKIYPQMLKLLGEVCEETGYLQSLKSISPQDT